MSVAAAVQLKLHFDELITAAAAAPAPVSADGEQSGSDLQLLSLPANPARQDPAGPQTAIGSSVDEALSDNNASDGDLADGDSGDVEADPGGRAFEPDTSVWVDPASSGRPWSDLGTTEGLLTFRGNPTRTFHGQGPVPTIPRVQWQFTVGCSNSPVGGEAKEWCGSGWTGQPAVFRLPTSGAWTVAFGAYNRRVNFLDPATGREALPPYQTGDIIKGSVTVDPDGYPLLYTGSRDNFFHVVALDGTEPTTLWQLSYTDGGPTLWNNDWDGSALVIDDHLFIGGENSRFYIVKLNRGYNAAGSVTVDPEIVFTTEGWDSELLAAIGDQQVSVENSVAISGNTVYFTNSGGLVQGWNIAGLDDGETPNRVFRYWTGDDTDASIVIDDEGMLYVGSEYERLNTKSRELGQILKLDPSRTGDPVVWSRQANAGPNTGVWATPALYGDLVIVATDDGQLIGLDRSTGEDRWRIPLEGPLWSSPVIVDDTLVQADCGGVLHAFALEGIEPPSELWSIELGGCLESTPAVWNGQIFIGSRSGQFFAVGD